MMGNKGGAAIRMKLMDSTVCFVCSHLAAHRENVAGRNADFHKWWHVCASIVGSATTSGSSRRKRITSDVPTLRVFDYARDDLDYLLKKDQVEMEESTEW